MTALPDTRPQALPALDDRAREILFTAARTANSFSPDPVSDETLTSIWELAKWPPTMANTQPLRVHYVRSAEGKARLLPLMAEGNRAKTETAPAVALLAADVEFHEFTDRTFPIRPELKDQFAAAGPEGREGLARFNGALQVGYFLLAARAHGLATGPMGGFDVDAVTAEFFPGGRHRTLLVVNLGLPGADPWFDRLPRLAHDDVVTWS
jgi:3-hydroxypropanoate dehydrogenase